MQQKFNQNEEMFVHAKLCLIKTWMPTKGSLIIYIKRTDNEHQSKIINLYTPGDFGATFRACF